MIKRIIIISLLTLIYVQAASLEYPGPVDILGPIERVFDWSTSAQPCRDSDMVDGGAHAFRDADGNIQLLCVGDYPLRMIGPDFNHLVRDCSNGPLFHSHRNGDPSMYDDAEWLGPTYTFDGATIYALVHSEFHGWEHGMCTVTDVLQWCWYNSITFMVSTDTGRSYSHATPPAHFVGTHPYRYVMNGGRQGYMGPSSLVYNRADGYYYCTFSAPAFRLQRGGTCLMRTRTINDPSSWRAWNGTDFTVTFVDPYRDVFTDTAAHMAVPLPGEAGGITWNTYFNKWIAIICARFEDPDYSGRLGCGFFYCLSDDLIHWTGTQLIKKINLAGWNTTNPGITEIGYYPSIIDHSDTSRNFEITGREVYLYYVQWQNSTISTKNRDIVRIPIRLNKRIVSEFTVNSTADSVDSHLGDGVCQDNSGKCTMRAAIMESNYRYYRYTDSIIPIKFNLSNSHTIKINSALPTISHPVAINGYSQTGAIQNTAAINQPVNTKINIEIDCDGNPGITADGKESSIEGVAITNPNGPAISLSGSKHVVKGCFIGIDTNGLICKDNGNDGIAVYASACTIGGTIASSRNIILGGVRLNGVACSTNVIAGNFIGCNKNGNENLSQNSYGIIIENMASKNIIGGYGINYRNLISGNKMGGILLTGNGTTNNNILCNIIGPRISLDSIIGNNGPGIYIKDSANSNQIGAANYGNIIGGGIDAGIWIENAQNTIIKGNYIGTDSAGIINLGNSGNGILFYKNSDNTIIGGEGNGEGNIIKYNVAGIAIRTDAGYGIKISGNSITSNKALGIDLGWNNMVEENDSLDVDDDCANGFQNYPILTSATKINTYIKISGILSAKTSQKYKIQFFADSLCDETGFGEGKIFLGYDSVITSSSGIATFSSNLTTNFTIDTGWIITATAIDSFGNTSEFSACCRLKLPQGILSLSVDSLSTTLDTMEEKTFKIIISNTGTANISWNATKNFSWISNLSPASGIVSAGSSDSFYVTIDASGLQNNSYYDTIVINGTNLTKAIKIPVSLFVIKQPHLIALPDTLKLTVIQNVNSTANITLKNTGSAILRWNLGVSFEDPWIIINTTNRNGTLLPYDSINVPITISGINLPLGLDTGIIIVHGYNLNGEPTWNTSFDYLVIIDVKQSTSNYAFRNIPKEFTAISVNKLNKQYFHFAIPYSGEIEFKIFNMHGQLIASLNKQLNPGFYLFADGFNSLPRGTYYYRIYYRSKEKTLMRIGKMILLN